MVCKADVLAGKQDMNTLFHWLNSQQPHHKGSLATAYYWHEVILQLSSYFARLTREGGRERERERVIDLASSRLRQPSNMMQISEKSNNVTYICDIRTIIDFQLLHNLVHVGQEQYYNLQHHYIHIAQQQQGKTPTCTCTQCIVSKPCRYEQLLWAGAYHVNLVTKSDH